ncbi:MAG TPA: hypothetical protein VJV97_09515 [Gemmatimonadaceae bacterium]|nr:hypothetical protein [Gemmatimonadaceae bacterium]
MTVADPSPKFHEYVVETVVFADVLVKLQVKPEHDFLKLAVSGGGGAASLPVYRRRFGVPEPALFTIPAVALLTSAAATVAAVAVGFVSR